MIKINKLKPENILHYISILSTAPHDFYLCGSRLWGTSTPDSDYDFFTQYNLEVREFLINNGFRDKAEMDDAPPSATGPFGQRLPWLNRQQTPYADGNTAEILSVRGIDVVLVRDLNLRLMFQEYVIQNNVVIPKGDVEFCRNILETLRTTRDESVTEHRKIILPE